MLVTARPRQQLNVSAWLSRRHCAVVRPVTAADLAHSRDVRQPPTHFLPASLPLGSKVYRIANSTLCLTLRYLANNKVLTPGEELNAGDEEPRLGGGDAGLEVLGELRFNHASGARPPSGAAGYRNRAHQPGAGQSSTDRSAPEPPHWGRHRVGEEVTQPGRGGWTRATSRSWMRWRRGPRCR